MVRYCLAVALLPLSVIAQDERAKQPKKAWTPPADITYRTADIMSEGARMAAEVYAPKKSKDKKLPTIVMSHGWGGTAQMLRPDAIVFARAGYLVVAFDYRGWGNSDSRVILTKPAPKRQGKELTFTAQVKRVREVVDPIDQTTDIMNAIHWTMAEKQCDPNRLGIWGSSYSGGHVAYVAAREPRVKALVSQVPAYDSRWVITIPAMRIQTYRMGTARARGKLGYPEPGARSIGNLKGAPILEKLAGYAPIEDVHRVKAAMLFILAEKEELFDNREHGILAHKKATAPKKLVIVPGIKHYGIYNEARGRAQKEAIAWFDEHLKKGSKE